MDRAASEILEYPKHFQFSQIKCHLGRQTTRPPCHTLLPLHIQALRELALLPDPRALDVRHIDRDSDQDSDAGKDRAAVLEVVLVAHVLIEGLDAASASLPDGKRDRMLWARLTVAYMADTPARKSLAKPFPPDAEAEYSP